MLLHNLINMNILILKKVLKYDKITINSNKKIKMSNKYIKTIIFPKKV